MPADFFEKLSKSPEKHGSCNKGKEWTHIILGKNGILSLVVEAYVKIAVTCFFLFFCDAKKLITFT